MADLVQHLEESLQRHSLLPHHRPILVAVSGGLDSLVLLHLLHRLAPTRGWRLAVAHFNHQLRSRAADADERLVRKTARRLGLRCLVGRASVRRRAKLGGVSLEMAGRQLRHDFLARAARRLGLDTIALAHHADDQVELFFLRLLRGTGSGVAGMKWSAPSPADPKLLLVRPLLDLPKRALASFAAAAGIRYREDATNRDTGFLRNRLRHNLIPLLARDYQPALAKMVWRLTQIIGEEHDFLAAAAGDWLRRKHRIPFDQLHAAVQRECLRRQLADLRVPEDFDLVEHLRAFPTRPVMVAPDITLCRTPAGLIRRNRIAAPAVRTEQRAVRLSASPGRVMFSGVRFGWRQVGASRCGRPIKPHAGLERFDAEKVGRRIHLRHWRPGDRFRPIGMAQPVKLQDLFTNQKVPRHRRHALVVATTAAGEVFWVEGQRISERFMLDKQSRRCLKWYWQRLSAPA